MKLLDVTLKYLEQLRAESTRSLWLNQKTKSNVIQKIVPKQSTEDGRSTKDEGS